MELEQIKLDMESILERDLDKIRFIDSSLKSLKDYSKLEKSEAELLLSSLIQIQDTLKVAGLYYKYFGNTEDTKRINGLDNYFQTIRNDITDIMCLG